MASVPQPTLGAARQELYRRMDKDNLAPLWEVLHELIPNEPATAWRPARLKDRQGRRMPGEGGGAGAPAAGTRAGGRGVGDCVGYPHRCRGVLVLHPSRRRLRG